MDNPKGVKVESTSSEKAVKKAKKRAKALKKIKRRNKRAYTVRSSWTPGFENISTSSQPVIPLNKGKSGKTKKKKKKAKKLKVLVSKAS